MTRVGLLFPGEMGAIVGAAADGDVLWASKGRSPATATRAEEAGFRDAGADVIVYRYEWCGHWFAETGSPGYEPAAAALARDRVLERLSVPAR